MLCNQETIIIWPTGTVRKDTCQVGLRCETRPKERRTKRQAGLTGPSKDEHVACKARVDVGRRHADHHEGANDGDSDTDDSRDRTRVGFARKVNSKAHGDPLECSCGHLWREVQADQLGGSAARAFEDPLAPSRVVSLVEYPGMQRESCQRRWIRTQGGDDGPNPLMMVAPNDVIPPLGTDPLSSATATR